jgi:hypothetical protein
MLLFKFLSLSLLLNLTLELISHSLLIRFHFVEHDLVIESVLNFFLLLKSSNFIFLLSCLGVHLLQNSVSHSSHKLLCALFSPLKFLSSVSFLLKEHLSISILCLNVLDSFSLFLSKLLLFMLVVLLKHKLEILFLLSLLLELDHSFLVHLVFESADNCLFLVKFFFFHVALSSLFLFELVIS